MRGLRKCGRCDQRSGSTDHPACRRGETDSPRADPGPLEEAVGEREDRSTHETLSGVAKQENLALIRMPFETTIIDHDTDAVDAYCAPALLV